MIDNKTQNIYRTHKCEEINKKHEGERIKISGWIRKKRNHGHLLFIDLYDQTNMVQCIIHKDHKLYKQIESINLESVVTIVGEITPREIETVNKSIPSGEVEVNIEEFIVLNESKELPFALHQKDLNEELQLKNRFLYLRKSDMQEILKLRSNIIDHLRKEMKRLGFLEIQTPLLSSPSPEGARDYIVPSRMHPGKFYALPQAPQQFKQLLMASGVEKYFQIAPCFRDEDSRADRLIGEFYQLDFEMAFATQEDVLNTLENVLISTFETFQPNAIITKKFPRIKYQDSIETYGSDKPDLRNPLKIIDITNQDTPKIFENLVKNNGKVITISAQMEYNNNELKKLTKIMQDKGAKGLAYCYLQNNAWNGPLSKMLKKETIEQATKHNNGTILFLIADEYNMAYKLGGYLREELGKLLNLINENEYNLCFITDFPMFEKKDNGSWDFTHNPFSMPQNLDVPLEQIISYQYDVVCNGYEITSGAVRNHDLNLIHKVFSLINQDSSNLENRFPVFKSFKYGVPPHAGAAPGIDRIIMLISKKTNVRDIVPFPMNQKGENLLMDSPCTIDDDFLKDLGIKIKL